MVEKSPRAHRPYQLVEYNPAWKEEFRKIADFLRKVFGEEIIDIQHVGSTAIPGTIAKPQIDISVVVKDLAKIKPYYKAMEEAEFTPRGNYTGKGEEYFTRDSKDGSRTVSVHIYPQGHPKIEAMLMLRDYLLMHREDCELYSAIKKKLYLKFANDYPAYCKAKKEAMEPIKERARTWQASRITERGV